VRNQQKKRGGGPKHGRYYGPLKRQLKWRKDAKDDLDTALLKDLREDARNHLIANKVKDIPKSRSAFNAAIKKISIELACESIRVGDSSITQLPTRR